MKKIWETIKDFFLWLFRYEKWIQKNNDEMDKALEKLNKIKTSVRVFKEVEDRKIKREQDLL